MIKVIIISDIKIYCEGLGQILSQIDSIEITGLENNIEDAIKKIELSEPDVVLLDMNMVDSCSVAHAIVGVCSHTKVLALAVPEDESNIIECAEAGIAGYIAREASLDELIDTVIGTKKGEFYCPPKIAAFIFKTVQNIAQSAKKNYLPKVISNESQQFEGLTKRERQIVSLLVDGMSNKQIARSLCIEVSTVKNHVHNVLVKLGVKSRTQAVSLLQRGVPASFPGVGNLI